MKKILFFSAAIFALVAADGEGLAQKIGKIKTKSECKEDKCVRILKEQKAAAEAHRGRKIVLVDLDDKRQLREYEEEGICINIGDMIFVTGLEDACNG